MVNKIEAEYVNVVLEQGNGLQKMKLSEAIKIAEESGEDVVLLNDKCDIPVVKIMSYSKFVYERDKKAKENKKKARLKSQDTKEIVISDVIAEHDLQIKANNIDRIIKKGDKVKITIKYKGRSIRFINEGPSKLQNLAALLKSEYKVEKAPKIDGNNVSMIIVPNNK